jgi:hypothetical protein
MKARESGMPDEAYWNTFFDAECVVKRLFGTHGCQGDAVEMEAAALYAFAAARGRAVVCFAHVTNQLGTVDNDFEKGHADGVHDALALIRAAAGRWRSQENRHMDGPRFAVA